MKNLLYRLLPLFFGWILIPSCGPKTPDTEISPTRDELSRRISMILERIGKGTEPKITDPFLLAELSLDPAYKRRFTEYSGDQIGRYLSMMSKTDTCKNNKRMRNLIRSVASFQCPDGRFGDCNLWFGKKEGPGDPMALLWGNGRLLAGLMDYYAVTGDTTALEVAVKLGDFLLSITGIYLDPDMAGLFKERDASGYICFTQLTEGFVKLWKSTGDDRYLRTAQQVYRVLPEMGNQHTHGYLNTLRGALLLYRFAGDTVALRFVINRFDEVLASDDYMVTGGVPEFFGNQTVRNRYNDEGCSEADLVMLALELWETNAEMKYLEVAERGLYNHLFPNQFYSGDFGHHPVIPGFGFGVSPSEGKAWWCCNYHGYMALRQVEDHIITRRNDTCWVNLFFEKKTNGSGSTVSLIKENLPGEWNINLEKTEHPVVLAIRKPAWVEKMEVRKNGQLVENSPYMGYFFLENKTAGTQIKINHKYKLQFTGMGGEEISWASHGSGPVKAALFYGPHLMCVDDGYSPQFMAEPSGQNVIYASGLSGDNTLEDNPFYFSAEYLHDGFYGKNRVVLRPFSETSFQRPSNVRIWLNFVKE